MNKSLFEASEQANFERAQPLAARMRPQSLDEFVGQRHFLDEGKLLHRLLKADRIGSVIFYGPPGTGKTTLARLLARESSSQFQQLSAVTSGVKDLREVLQLALGSIGDRRRKDAAIHRRNPSLQQSSAGCLAAGCGRRNRDLGGRHDFESVLRGEQRPGKPQSGVSI